MIFSVIIPCYNSSATIVRALDSVVCQSMQDFEIVIVDDGSKDNTKEVVDEFFAGKNINYKYIYQQNGGAGKARNTAVKNASGEYLAFLDADDEWHKDKLHIQYDQIKKYNAKFVSTTYTYDDLCEVNEVKVKQYSFDDFLVSNRTSTPCTVLSKEVFDAVGGFSDTQRYSEDYFLWLNVVYKEPLYMIYEPSLVKLHKSAYGDSGLSSRLWEMEKGELGNFYHCYKKGYISIPKYIPLTIFSLIKFSIRVIKVFLKIKR